jgi:hypothetical protein
MMSVHLPENQRANCVVPQILMQLLTTFSTLQHPCVTNKRWIIQSKPNQPMMAASLSRLTLVKLIYNFFATTCLTGMFMSLVPGLLASMSLLAVGPH